MRWRSSSGSAIRLGQRRRWASSQSPPPRLGDLDRAARLCTASDAVRDRVGAVVPPWAAPRRAELGPGSKVAIGAARYDQLLADFGALSFAETVRTAG